MPKLIWPLALAAVALSGCSGAKPDRASELTANAALTAEAAERQANIDAVKRNPSVIDRSQASAAVIVRNNTHRAESSGHAMAGHDMAAHPTKH